jgi:3-hydroxyisobutyryl-CoA hydrolase
MGGGVGLSWHSPIRIATENSIYAMPETAIGFFAGVGGSYFLPRVYDGDISLGLYIGMSGTRVSAEDLVTLGLATHFVPQDRIAYMSKDIES